VESKTRTVTQATVIVAILYAILFASHIFTAAMNYNLGFKIVAALITVMTFSVGFCIQIIGQFQETEQKLRSITVGFVFSLALSVGLSWAYAEQSFEVWRTITFLSIAAVVHTVHRTLVLRNGE
jgi:hypothetical protein|tara:strand:- start:56 stop:427 length:372 start_codon:yes stop_codon:yes gene_type:complete